LALVLMTGNENYTIPVGLRTFVDAFRANWGPYSAAATLVTIPVALLFLWAQKYLVGGLTSGGVKG
jgi:ABC-type maltose transport system permease subunit